MNPMHLSKTERIDLNNVSGGSAVVQRHVTILLSKHGTTIEAQRGAALALRAHYDDIGSASGFYVLDRIVRRLQAWQEPAVGMGATVRIGTDCYAATVIDVTRYKSGPLKGQAKAVTVQRDYATRTDTNGQSDQQDYHFRSDPNGVTSTHALVNGRFDGVTVGHRREYYDYSF